MEKYLIERSILLEESKILRFLDITKDFNPIHRRNDTKIEAKIAPGMYLAASFSDLIEKGLKNFDKNYVGCEFSFRKLCRFPAELNQTLYFDKKKQEISLVAEQAGAVLIGKVKVNEKISEKKELENLVRVEKIKEEDFNEFLKTVNSNYSEVSIKNFLISLIPGALVENFAKDGGIYLKQEADFKKIDYSSVFNKELKIYIKMLNDSKMIKFRTAGAIDNQLVFDGYALAMR